MIKCHKYLAENNKVFVRDLNVNNLGKKKDYFKEHAIKNRIA